ncbi:formimidoylglutamate deiminase [Martelella endophytica]|uniref:N-formimino-L-glutamate deiminase n=1 Tax=Martelella endophytica TaxID=1486262 RepID=A0A0D5LJY3_MAREN|nr:formimidoylglutamate deiminase [Martelella endophytica]AJY44499.1 N-formimino-L-glutamate deiminase [Martelella endophytica]
MASHLFAENILTPEGWRANARLAIKGGRIADLAFDQTPQPGDERHGIIVPAIANVHSHAFQRAMAGLAERRGPASDNFWSWREVMYRFTFALLPDEAEAIAAQLYMEMLEAGFARVGEFHYLHNDKDGSLYGNIGEMAERIAAAAGETGIGLTLLPVFYAHSDFGGAAPNNGQRRFIHDRDSFARLMEASAKIVSGLDHAVLGVAPHSLRAVTPEELDFAASLTDGPVHMHISEQTKEVDDCLAWSGKRPVEWLLENTGVDGRWCLIHATHMTDAETDGLARSGAVAGLCPVTEANLGDGIFPASRFLAAGGAFGVGSDSNVLIGLADELRQLEYAQRLGERARNVVAEPGGTTGRYLFDGALSGGAQAMGIEAGIADGRPASFFSLDNRAAPWLSEDQSLDGFIFAGQVKPDCVWANGVKQVEGGRHMKRAAIEARFRKAMTALMARSG